MVYPHTKWLSECAVHDGIARGLDAVVTHPGMIFGPWDWKYNLLPLFTTARGRGVLPLPKGHRTTCDVRDVARAHVAAAQKGGRGEHYILGGECLSVADLFTRLSEVTGGKKLRFELPDGLFLALGRTMDAASNVSRRPPLLSWEMALQSTFRAHLSSAKAERELDYRPRPLSQSLADAARWYRERSVL